MTHIHIQQNTDGYMIIKIPKGKEICLYLPILKEKGFDDGTLIYSDVLFACNMHVPKIPNITNDFYKILQELKYPQVSKMEYICRYTQEHLLYGLYDMDNPGHLFVLLHCFGGYWAGIATQLYTSCLMHKCVEIVSNFEAKSLKENKEPSNGREMIMMIGILGAICKCFGSSCRTPLIPHFPSGSPPDPVVLLCDTIMAYTNIILPSDRNNLINAMREWHIPRCIRENIPNYKIIWQPHYHIDRTRTFIELQYKLKTQNL